MSVECACVFCTTPSASSFPLPALVVRSSDLMSFWVWIVDAHPLKVRLAGTCFDSFEGAAREAWPRFLQVPFDPEQFATTKIVIKTSSGVALWTTTSENLIRSIAAGGDAQQIVGPTTQDTASPICIRMAAPPCRTAVVSVRRCTDDSVGGSSVGRGGGDAVAGSANGAKVRGQRVGRAPPLAQLSLPASSSSSSSSGVVSSTATFQSQSHRTASGRAGGDTPMRQRKRTKQQCASRDGDDLQAPRTCASRLETAPPSSAAAAAAAAAMAVVGDERDGWCSSERAGGMSSTCATPADALPHLAYDMTKLGGQEDEVRNLVSCRNKWDAEVVEELIRWGAKPVLYATHSIYDGGQFPRVQCTFVQLDGRLVRDVWMPLAYMHIDYAEHFKK